MGFVNVTTRSVKAFLECAHTCIKEHLEDQCSQQHVYTHRLKLVTEKDQRQCRPLFSSKFQSNSSLRIAQLPGLLPLTSLTLYMIAQNFCWFQSNGFQFNGVHRCSCMPNSMAAYQKDNTRLFSFFNLTVRTAHAGCHHNVSLLSRSPRFPTCSFALSLQIDS